MISAILLVIVVAIWEKDIKKALRIK